MNLFSQKRAWFWIAIAAIFIALIALLVPHVNGTGQPDWLALLPIFFIGLIVPLSLTPSRAFLSPDHAPETPALVPSFQRPPPSLA